MVEFGYNYYRIFDLITNEELQREPVYNTLKIEDAEKLAASGEIKFEPCHHHNTVGPMAGVVSPSMWVYCIKNVTYNEPFFMGHFPGIPVMPGVLIVEAMAQTAGILAIKTDNIILDNKVVYFAGIDKCRFRTPVVPGDVLILEGKNVKHKGPVWKVDCVAYVDNKIVTEAVLTATIADAK